VGTTTAAATKASVLKFRKMHGIGNDFVMVDGVRSAVPAADPAALARQVCDRRFGVGADGLIYIEREQVDAFRMRMWNPDGSESEMCGNGIRCVARYLIDEGVVGQGSKIPVETGAGLLVLEDAGEGRVRVDMGLARLTRGEIGMVGPAEETFIGQKIESAALESCTTSATAVSMGNPHLVLIVRLDELDDIDLAKVGPVLEHHALFPNRVNVHFVQVLDRGHIRQRTWERGAGITLACGTGACACAVAAFLNGLTDRSVDVDLPGGRLHIDYAEDGRVFMTGPAETVFDGEWELSSV
jgi:diaminopimelate epimerase